MSTLEDKLRLVLAARSIGEARKIAALALGETLEPARKGMGAEAFFDAWSAACRRAHATDPRWDLDPAMGGWAERPCGASFTTEGGTLIRIPAVLRCPVARYWPDGELPAGLAIMHARTEESVIRPAQDQNHMPTLCDLLGVADDVLARDLAECERLAREWGEHARADHFASLARAIRREMERRHPSPVAEPKMALFEPDDEEDLTFFPDDADDADDDADASDPEPAPAAPIFSAALLADLAAQREANRGLLRVARPPLWSRSLYEEPSIWTMTPPPNRLAA